MARPSKSLDEILWKKSWFSLSNSDVSLNDGRLTAKEQGDAGGGDGCGGDGGDWRELGLGFAMMGVSIEIDGERERGWGFDF